MRVPVPLSLEVAAARAAGALSRLAGRGGGTTLPGKLLWKVDPGAIDRLAARLPQGSALVSATNGKTTTAAMAAEILPGRFRLAHNDSGANLVSGVASTLLEARGRRARALRGRRGRPARGGRARAAAGRLPRQPLPRPARPLRRARARRRALAGRRRRPPPRHRRSSLDADDPQVASLARLGARERRSSGSTTSGTRGPSSSTRPTRSGASAAGRRTSTRAAYVGHLGDYRCPNCGHARPALDVVAREIELAGVDHAAFTLVTPEASARVRLRLPGLYNVYNALAAAALARDAGRAARRDRRRGSSASAPRSGASSASSSTTGGCSCSSSRTRPARTRRCGRCVQGGAAAHARGRAQRRDRRRPGRLVDLGRRLRAAASPGSSASSRPARAPPSSRSGSSTAASTRRAIEVEPALERALDRGLELVAAGRGARRAPDLHGDARAAADRRRARPRAALLGARSVTRIVVGHLYPDYLNIYADRGNIAVLERRARWRGHELDVRAVGARRRRAARRDRPLLRRRRPGPRAGADRTRPRRQGRRAARGGRGRRGAARRLRRLPAARPLLPRHATASSSRASASSRTRRSPATAG